MDDLHRADLRRREPEGDADGTVTRVEPLSRSSERHPAEWGHGQASPGEDAADERGRRAKRPSEIAKRGWKDILWRVYGGLVEDRILMNAAGVAFYALLALFPTFTAFVSIYGLFADP